MTVGVYDRHWNNTGDPATSGFVLQSSTLGTGNLDHRVIMEGEVVGTGETGYYVVDATTGEIATDVSTNGWYYHLLEDRERCLGDFTLYQGALLFLTFTPDISDPCVRGGLSNLYGVYYTSGTSLTEAFIDITGEGDVDIGDLIEDDNNDRRGSAVLKLTKGFAGGGLKIKRFFTTGGGYQDKAYPPLPENPPLTIVPPGPDSTTGITSWREVLQ
jgi:Tfp pilus tip-associated adhesin PilY1